MTSVAISPYDSVSLPVLPRAVGELRVSFAADGGKTRYKDSYQQGCMRVRFPRVTSGTAPEAVIINTSGGLTDGDRLLMSVRADDHAYGVMTGQACERIYQSREDEAEINANITIAEHGRIDWIPQPTILFDQGRFRRMNTVRMAANATLLAVEGVIFGRTAMKEDVLSGSINDGWRIYRNKKLVFADNFRLKGAIHDQLQNAAVLGGQRAMATVLYVAPDAEARLEQTRELIEKTGAKAAASAWDGILSIRIVAASGGVLVSGLTSMLTGLRDAPLPRVWTL